MDQRESFGNVNKAVEDIQRRIQNLDERDDESKLENGGRKGGCFWKSREDPNTVKNFFFNRRPDRDG